MPAMADRMVGTSQVHVRRKRTYVLASDRVGVVRTSGRIIRTTAPHVRMRSRKVIGNGAVVTNIGTPGFIAPELAAGLPVTFATDLFSLGVTALEARPVQSSPRVQTQRRVRTYVRTYVVL